MMYNNRIVNKHIVKQAKQDGSIVGFNTGYEHGKIAERVNQDRLCKEAKQSGYDSGKRDGYEQGKNDDVN